ncbi:hypothetical protein, partial [Shinella sp.]
MGEGAVVDDAALARLLRFLLVADGAKVTEDEALAADGRRQRLAPTLLAEAVRRGLVRREGDRAFAAGEARAYLRRRL